MAHNSDMMDMMDIMRGLRESDTEKAIGIFKGIVRRNLYVPKAHFNWGYCYAELADQQGKQDSDQWPIWSPNECIAEFHLGAGMKFARLGKQEVALFHLRKAFILAHRSGNLTGEDFCFTLSDAVREATEHPPVETFQKWVPSGF